MSVPMLLLVGSGPAPLRRYAIEAAAAEQPLLLIDSQEPTWQRPYIVDHVVTDLTDSHQVLGAAASLGRHWPIGGVLTFDEYHLVTAARLAEHLQLPATAPIAVGAARDKATSRHLFAACDVPSAAFTWVHSLEAAASAAERLGGYPVVLKPAAHAGSVGVVRVNHITELPDRWAIASTGAAHQGPEGDGVLLEEFLDGPEISVETVTQNGFTTAVAVTRKALGFAPYFMETGHRVEANDPLLDDVAPIASAALRALGITHGVSHVEMRLTPDGPRLIEVNARVGGDRIGELVRHATGVDLVKAAAALACGREPDLTPTTARAAAIGMIYPPADGIVTSLALKTGDDTHLEDLQWLCDVGDEVTLTPSPRTPGNIRAGFAIVTGDSAEAADRHLSDVLDRTAIGVRTTMVNVA
ncbi:acetyl-CoA carboxylase biotin carboxylase subunit family protein [Streptomyces sp. NPDC053474]|uniref:acetyl-CoA carboxylase biotin carboxylase subunit family protein n=1 Tax=Streptomyces sp. NPDC053474 TaxID=3365704 RepID=UPI0037D8FA40